MVRPDCSASLCFVDSTKLKSSLDCLGQRTKRMVAWCDRDGACEPMKAREKRAMGSQPNQARGSRGLCTRSSQIIASGVYRGGGRYPALTPTSSISFALVGTLSHKNNLVKNDDFQIPTHHMHTCLGASPRSGAVRLLELICMRFRHGVLLLVIPTVSLSAFRTSCLRRARVAQNEMVPTGT
eukprot:626857-Rhodomonas_salina.2